MGRYLTTDRENSDCNLKKKKKKGNCYLKLCVFSLFSYMFTVIPKLHYILFLKELSYKQYFHNYGNLNRGVKF